MQLQWTMNAASELQKTIFCLLPIESERWVNLETVFCIFAVMPFPTVGMATRSSDCKPKEVGETKYYLYEF